MIEKFRASDGAQIAFRDSGGSGPALLCLAGLTRNSTDFDYVLPHLKGVRVIRMDYRGRGESGWSGASTYTIPRESMDAVELLDHLGIGAAAILGTSRGGIIAMGLAATVPHRLTGVVLNDIGPLLETSGLNVIRDYIGRDPDEKSYWEAAQMRAKLTPGFHNVPLSRWDQEVRLHYRETAEGLKIRYDPALADAVHAAFEAPPVDLWPFFYALAGRPVAALRGENSGLLSAETFSKMKDRIPEMIVSTVPDRGHVPFLDEPASLSVLEKFLQEIR